MIVLKYIFIGTVTLFGLTTATSFVLALTGLVVSPVLDGRYLSSHPTFTEYTVVGACVAVAVITAAIVLAFVAGIGAAFEGARRNG